jgi:hypothetical protein
MAWRVAGSLSVSRTPQMHRGLAHLFLIKPESHANDRRVARPQNRLGRSPTYQ